VVGVVTAAQNASKSGDSRRPRALIIDDDEGMRTNMSLVLESGGFDVASAPDGAAGLARLERTTYDVVLLDIQMPGMSGLEVLARVRERFADVEVVMVTVLKEIPTVVEAMKLGAFDFLTKDFRPSELLHKARQAVAHRRTAQRLAFLESEVARATPSEMVLGKGRAMQEVHALVEKVAPLPATVLIAGESGTGKELLARRVHQVWCDARQDPGRPFVPVNLAAIPPELIESTLFGHEKGAFTGATGQHYGKFEHADGGTLFLDEIGELRIDLQAKLLRAIQEREIERVGGKRPVPIDVRLVAATNVDLQKAVREGKFRDDLFYRINVIPVRLPPLRERIEDLPDLVRHFLERHARRFGRPVPGVSDDALDLLSRHAWPGNVRELENVVERLVAVAEGPVIEESDLPLEFCYPRFFERGQRHEEEGLSVAIEAFERSFISSVLDRCDWNRKVAATELGIGYSTLKKKLKRLGLFGPENDGE
jgi:DNA-binding NtrC family response regulator